MNAHMQHLTLTRKRLGLCRSIAVAAVARTQYRVGDYTEAPMPLNIRSEQVNRLARTLAERTRTTKTEAVKNALKNELRRIEQKTPLRERLRALQARVQARPATGLDADKAFYDELSGQG